jgi:sugar phosphate permease
VAIIVSFGWRWVFYIFGGVGAFWSLLWYLTYRNLPELHKWCSQEELAFIRGTDEKGNIKQLSTKKKPAVPWGVLLRSPNMWAVMCAYFPYVYCLWIFLSWLPSYLVEYRHFTLLKMGYFASLPLFAGVIGDTVGGWATDYLLMKTGKTNFSRRIVAITAMLGTVVFIVPAALTDNAYTAVYCLTASMFFLECTIGPAWAVPMDVGGEYSGTVSGMMNMAGNIGGALSPTVFGILVQFGSWKAPFIVAASLLVTGALIWAFWLSPETSVLEKRTADMLTPAATRSR